MMGHQPPYQHKFFVKAFNLDKRIRPDHILRKILGKVDFDFIYQEVKETYGANGNVSVPPAVILKMMLLLVLYNVRSERELMLTIPERLDWMWFLGYDLHDEVPDHSVLSKARSRWGVEAFKRFFERIVWQCVEARLVDGKKLFVDASLIDADASNNSVIDKERVKKDISKSYHRLEERLDDLDLSKTAPADSRFVSTTDPDASVTRQSVGKSKLRYKTHRVVDPEHEVITATQVTPGAVNEGELLAEMIDQHKSNTHSNVKTAVADSRYGSIENFLLCSELKVRAPIPSLEERQRGSGRQKGIFPKEAFSYDSSRDLFVCPAGEELRRRNYSKTRRHYEYKAPQGACAKCALSLRCTAAKDGRTLKRHERQEDLDRMLREARTPRSGGDLKTRQHLSERSFARSTRYGYKRARWRRLWRVRIQDFLIATVQNILVLVTKAFSKLSKSKGTKGIDKGSSKPRSLSYRLVYLARFYIRVLLSVKNEYIRPPDSFARNVGST
jgi:transposase